jgi:glycosyltransferase involved in cell wall biosynthesis
MKARGHEVQVLVSNQGWLPEILHGERIRVESSYMRGTGYYRTIARLVKQVRRERIDVLHAHLTRASYISYFVGLVTGVPVVTSVHIANNDQIYRRLARRHNRLIAVSNFVRGMLHGKGVPERFIETIYNGTDFVDLPPSNPGSVKAELGIPQDRMLIGLVGRVCPDKGQIELIQAMKQVRTKHPQAHVVFVGRVSQDYRSDVDDAIDAAGLRSHSSITGVRHDIPRMLDAFTMSTLPSKMETFGVAAIEAMARGKAVVATRVGALPEVVRHRHTGLLVDLRPDEIAEAVGYLLDNAAEREEMGRRGRFLVEQKFSIAEMVGRFENVYRKAAGRWS